MLVQVHHGRDMLLELTPRQQLETAESCVP